MPALVVAMFLAAGPLPRSDVPEPLRPWIPWALHGAEASLCPQLTGTDRRSCAFAGRLDLDLGPAGGRFSLPASLAAGGPFALPGDVRRWPQDVRDGGRPVPVIEHEGRPAVVLAAGDHALSGAFVWDALPESLPVPPAIGLVSLRVRGTPVPFPARDAGGDVFLEARAAAPADQDLTELEVHRRVIDEVPLQLATHLTVRVSGRSREVVVGPVLPQGFVPMVLESQLPARLQPEGTLKLQVRAGTFDVTLVGRSPAPLSDLARPAAPAPWPEQEIWVLDARPSLRAVEVAGVPTVDPTQTTLPADWRALPAYLVERDASVALQEKRRGASDPGPDSLALDRRLWLDFDGGGFTASDHITGALRRSFRLSLPAPFELGRASVDGQDVLITRLEDGRPPGLEIRQGELDVSADSRIGEALRFVPVGWAQDFARMAWTLHLPPGWSLLAVTGADDVPGTWVRSWTLLDLFLALIVAAAVGHLFGWGAGALALATTALTFPEPGAPQVAWLVVLAFEALSRSLPSGRLGLALGAARVLSLVALVLILVPFAVHEVRRGLYPVLDEQGGVARAPVTEDLADLPAAAPEPEQAPSYGRKRVSSKLAGLTDNQRLIDPAAQVQTGPGLPAWTYRTVSVGFSGPVSAGQHVSLYLVSPTVNSILAFVRVLLAAALALVLAGLAPRLPRRAAAALVLLAAAVPARAQENVAPPQENAIAPPAPPPSILEELRARLLAPPPCAPSCAGIPRLDVDTTPSSLRLRLQVDAAAEGAVPLPGAADHWLPASVIVDGAPARSLLADGGVLWLSVSPGVHTVILEGPLPARDLVQVPLPLRPRRVDVRADGWSVGGVHEDGAADESLQLARSRPAVSATGEAARSLPPLAQVRREIQLGLNWQVTTTVRRLTPPGDPLVIAVPLLPGESVTDPSARVEDGKVQVNLGPQAVETSWPSALEQRAALPLVAAADPSFVEVWRLDAAPIWHVEAGGIPPVLEQEQAARLPAWRPWPGETVTLAITRPEAVPGQTLTLDAASLELAPGARATDATLSLHLRSSRGGQHVIRLPEGATVQEVRAGGAVLPIRQDGDALTLPVSPGSQDVVLTWREPRGVSTVFEGSRVVTGPAVNTSVAVRPGDRWVLLAGGPRAGPAVLFWSYLLVLLLVAFGLHRAGRTPLKVHEWLLLGVGLSQVPFWAAAIVAGWLILLGVRERSPELRWELFDLRQLALGFLTLVALGILVFAIQQGLLGAPEMQIDGNGSSAYELRWFQDRSAEALPVPWVLSMPLLVYRLAMLAWALWLAFALLRWLRWAWGAYTAGGIWRASEKRARPSAG